MWIGYTQKRVQDAIDQYFLLPIHFFETKFHKLKNHNFRSFAYIDFARIWLLLILKENVRNFKKLLAYLWWDNILSKNFVFYRKPVFRGKCQSYVFNYNVILKDRVLFKKSQPSIETDVIVVKKNIRFLKFRWKIYKIKVKKET